MLAIRRCSFGRRTTASTQKIAENVTSPSTVITLMAHNRYFQSIKKLSHAASSTKSSTIVQNSHSSERARINFFFLLKESCRKFGVARNKNFQILEKDAWPSVVCAREKLENAFRDRRHMARGPNLSYGKNMRRCSLRRLPKMLRRWRRTRRLPLSSDPAMDSTGFQTKIKVLLGVREYLDRFDTDTV